MLNIGKYLSVHILTPLLLAVCFFVEKLDIIVITYTTMIMHELSHTMAAVLVGLKIEKIILYPFGVNLRLKNKFVHSLSDEVILYVSGPLFNIFFAFISLLIYGITRGYMWQYLYFMNIALFAVNMLPVLPLDGGILAKKIIAYYFGNKKAAVLMRGISTVILVAVILFCIYSIAISQFNVSVIIIAVFLVGSILQGEEKYNVDFIRTLMFAKDKQNKRIKHILLPRETDMKDIAAQFVNNRYSIVYLTEANGKISDTITEREVIDRLL